MLSWTVWWVDIENDTEEDTYGVWEIMSVLDEEQLVHTFM